MADEFTTRWETSLTFAFLFCPNAFTTIWHWEMQWKIPCILKGRNDASEWGSLAVRSSEMPTFSWSLYTNPGSALYIHGVHGFGLFMQRLEGTQSPRPAPTSGSRAPCRGRGRRDGDLFLRRQFLLQRAVSDESTDARFFLRRRRDRKWRRAGIVA